jgi:hypothetical protein
MHLVPFGKGSGNRKGELSRKPFGTVQIISGLLQQKE